MEKTVSNINKEVDQCLKHLYKTPEDILSIFFFSAEAWSWFPGLTVDEGSQTVHYKSEAAD